MNRTDEPEKMNALMGLHNGGKALVIAGGPSAKDGGWQNLKSQINPDVIITANGATQIPQADFWMLAENMSRAANKMEYGNQRDQELMKMITAPNTAKIKLISHHNFERKNGNPSVIERFGINTSNVIIIKRKGYEIEEIPPNFTLREYREGFFYGGLIKTREAVGRRVQYHVGTVTMHMIHLAGILGCQEVHTIGYDLCFPNGVNSDHHWYIHPKYQPDKFRTEKMFTQFQGLDTMWDWMEAAEFISQIEYIFKRDRFKWVDHSHGLLSKMGLWCTDVSS